MKRRVDEDLPHSPKRQKESKDISTTLLPFTLTRAGAVTRAQSRRAAQAYNIPPRQTACQRFLDTFELVENVIKDLPACRLVSARKVCVSFRSVVDGSPDLRRKTFRQADFVASPFTVAGWGSRPRERTVLWKFRGILPGFGWTARVDRPVVVYHPQVLLAMNDDRRSAEPFSFPPLSHYEYGGDIPKPIFKPTHFQLQSDLDLGLSSHRFLLLTRPAITKVYVYGHYVSGATESERLEGTFTRTKGVTVGELFDRLERMRRSRLRSRKSNFQRLYFRFDDVISIPLKTAELVESQRYFIVRGGLEDD